MLAYAVLFGVETFDQLYLGLPLRVCSSARPRTRTTTIVICEKELPHLAVGIRAGLDPACFGTTIDERNISDQFDAGMESPGTLNL
jgi:hypothetical protein